MEIYLIRHTTPAINKGICYGQTDLELSVNFKAEAQVVLNKLPKDIDAVYSSPLKRCLTLAQKITSEVMQEDRLKELNFGDWEMKKWDNIPLKEIQPWYDDFVNTPPLNGESYRQLADRAINFLKELQLKNYKRVAIVTHSGIIRAMLSNLNNIALEHSFEEFNISYGEVVEITQNGYKFIGE